MYKLKWFLALSLLFSSCAPLHAENPSTLTESSAKPVSKRAALSDYYKKIMYETSLAYTRYRGQDTWWNQITPFNIYLGALPLKNKGHKEAIVDLGVTHVLSMVEDFEMQEGWFNTPVKHDEWKEQGIEVKHIQAVDCLPLLPEQLKEGIEYLAHALEEGKVVYVHCKAGRGRSASVVIGFLMKHQHLSFTEAFSLVQAQRPQINLFSWQRKAIEKYFEQEIANTEADRE